MNQPIEDQPGKMSRRGLLAATALGAGMAALPWLDDVADAQSIEPSDNQPSSQVVEIGDGDMQVKLSVNSREYPLKLDARVSLLDALRDHCGLTGTKKGCDHGQCGACTVLVNDRRVNSCLLLAIASQGKDIVTIEGLARGEQLHPMQAAFVEHDAFQCGYCTPGQICSAVGLLKEGRPETDDEIREGMSGNICRCGAYPNIVLAVKQVMHSQV